MGCALSPCLQILPPPESASVASTTVRLELARTSASASAIFFIGYSLGASAAQERGLTIVHRINTLQATLDPDEKIERGRASARLFYGDSWQT